MDLADNDVILTRQGYEQIKRELEETITVKRPAIVERIKEARLLGDLSENFDYQDAKRMQGILEGRVMELKALLDSAVVVDSANEDGTVGVGSKVVVRDAEDGSEEEYFIVGPAEASPADGKISHESSMGAALIGRKAGDKAEVHGPGGVFYYDIVSVS